MTYKITFIPLLAFILILSAGFTVAQKKQKDQTPGESKEIIKMPDEDEEETDEEDAVQDKRDVIKEKKKDKEKQEQTLEKKPGDISPNEEKEKGLVEVKEKRGPRFNFKGQAKDLYIFHRSDCYTGEYPLNTTSKNLSAELTRLRLSPEFLYKDLLAIKVDYDNELIWNNYGKSADFKSYWRPSQYNDLIHMEWEPYRGNDLYYRTKIHRGYLKLSVDKFSITVGRQQIRYGSGRLWNPLDILNPVSPTFVEGIEEQKGTDAVKMDIYPDAKTEISIVVNLKKSNDKIEHINVQDCNYLIRAKSSIEDVSIGVLGGYFSRRGVAGFDFAAMLFNGMLRGNLMVSQAAEDYITDVSPWYYLKILIPGKNQKSPIYFHANIGYEYNFKNGLYFLAEYFYNENASNYNKDLKAALYTARFNAMDQKTYLQLANQFLTVNQHYVGAALGYDFHPLVRGELFMIGDIQGGGIFWNPTIKVNAYKNLDVTVGMMGAFVFGNKTSDFSEYRKNYLFYASGRYVF